MTPFAAADDAIKFAAPELTASGPVVSEPRAAQRPYASPPDSAVNQVSSASLVRPGEDADLMRLMRAL